MLNKNAFAMPSTAAIGGALGAAAGLAHGLQKDPNGQRNIGQGLAEGAAGGLAGAAAGHLVPKARQALANAGAAKAVRSSPWAAGVVPAVSDAGHLALQPGMTVGQMMAQKTAFSSFVENVKEAFTTSQYSGPLNPVILSGASYLPPMKKPRLDQAIQKTSASAPTRGNFMMASDIPAFRAPRLDQAIQKTSGDAPEKKLAMSTAEMSVFVAELLKESAVNTPAGHLAHTQRVGAPKASAPPGPSISDQVKPRGAKWGLGLPGAMKSGIGGYTPPALR